MRRSHTPKRILTILMATAEVAPFSKAGGLGDVTNALSRTLAEIGHRVSVVTPLYGSIDTDAHRLEMIYQRLKMPAEDMSFNVWRTYIDEVPVYFIDIPVLFGRRKNIYGYSNDNKRFAVFNKAVLRFVQHMQFAPDIIHSHDWHSGLIPQFVKQSRSKYLQETATTYTIHNLMYQFQNGWGRVPKKYKDTGGSLPGLDSKAFHYVNFAKRAIRDADVVNTVSEQYAEEITTKEFGAGLQKLLLKRQEEGTLLGIDNGMDNDMFNPETDPGLFRNYGIDDLEGKAENKAALQKKFGLPVRADVPLIGIVSRLAHQKGFELLMNEHEPLFRMNIQMVVMGSGEKHLLEFFRKLAKRYPRKVAVHLKHNTVDATKVFAGSDMFLVPSKFEPFGLTPLIALRYGSIPVVRSVGGLASTVQRYNPRTKKGNGFAFKKYDGRDLLISLARATTVYQDQKRWKQLVQRAMRESHGWEYPAAEYVKMYRKALKLQNNGK